MEIFTLFWDGPFSQWYPSAFVVDGRHYANAEQYMMWFKDQVFGGTLEAEIMNTTDPREIKRLGRSIPNFIPHIWDAIARAAVYRGNIAKFTQNSRLMRELLNTFGTTLVEASPFDVIWGIGLAQDEPMAGDRATWKGKNWLGEVLTRVREDLLIGEKNEH